MIIFITFSCCIDERTSKPRGIEGIIHFGTGCLTSTVFLPVLYVYFCDLNEQNFLEKFHACQKLQEKDLIFLSDINNIAFLSKFKALLISFLCNVFLFSEKLHQNLKNNYPKAIISSINVPEKSTVLIYNSVTQLVDVVIDEKLENDCLQINNRKVTLPTVKTIDDYEFVYIGNNVSELQSLQLRYSTKQFYVFDNEGTLISDGCGVKSVMKRSTKIEKIKEAKIIGILVTLISNHQAIVDRLKKLIVKADKKCYKFFIGKVNEPKLGNFDAVDLFVYLGCPQSSLFNRNDSSYIYDKIVTPWEVEVALNPEIEWNLEFKTDFTELLLNKLSIETAEVESIQR